jgi:hypothetical protein
VSKPRIRKVEEPVLIARLRARGCFRCDGSGLICNICGESAQACRCDEENFAECPDCQPPQKGETK